MKILRLTLALVVGSPATAFAQWGNLMIHPTGLRLTHPTVLYRQLEDTLGKHYAHRLRPGAELAIQQHQPYRRWLKVQRHTPSGSPSATDTTTYYLPFSAAKSAILHAPI
jgi:hypothetical protein